MPAIVPEIVTLCAETLQGFVNETDQNLKYLGLVGFASLMASHPRVLVAPGYRPIILACLSDQDVTIRTRALSLLPGMASRKNLMELVSQLMKHVDLATGAYKLDLVSKIVEMCTGEKYALLSDFPWYLNILFQLAHMRGLDVHAGLLKQQIQDIALRVLPVRTFAVRRSIEILLEGESIPFSKNSSSDPYGDNGRGRHIMPEVLPSLAWIVGEYSNLIRASLSLNENDSGDDFLLDNSSEGTYHSLIQTFTSTSNFQKLPTTTQKVYLQNAFKVFAASTADHKVSDKELEESCRCLQQNLSLYMQSIDVEVQERAFTGHALLASMGLISGSDAPPAMDEASDSDEDEDLLGMEGSSQKSLKQKPQTPTSAQAGLVSKCRKQAAVLNYVLKPSPMKPTSAKSQRKKSQDPLGIDAAHVAAVDFSVFSALIADELASSSGFKVSMEAVSFTQQNPIRMVEPTPTPIANPPPVQMQAFGNAGIGNGNATAAFQRPDAFQISGTGLRPNQGDPFYLDSAPKSSSNDIQDLAQFGMIQLLDSDEDAASISSKKKKKKKKSRKEKRRGDSTAIATHENTTTIVGDAVAVYDSDDDDEPLQAFSARPKGASKFAAGKEFAGLAQVDLTEPLREDEVMPERRHRIVPDRPAHDRIMDEKTASKKERKRQRKEKKRAKKREIKENTVAADPFSNVSDLLDLGESFGALPTSSQPTAATPAQPLALNATSANAFSDAFGDLLGLDSSAPKPSLLAQSTPTDGASSEMRFSYTEKKIWMKATVKTRKSLSLSNVDADQVSVHFQVFPATGQDAAVHLAVRVHNAGSRLLSNTILQIDQDKSAVLGDIAPNSFVSSKIGPFTCAEVDARFDLKGTLSASGSPVNVKFSIPASIHLVPWNGLTLDDVSNELSSGNMNSKSIKLSFPLTMPSHSVKSILMGHLSAAEVDGAGTVASVTTCTLAAQSRGGTKLLTLLKVKDGVVKIDLKCSNELFLKELASELKKLEL